MQNLLFLLRAATLRHPRSDALLYKHEGKYQNITYQEFWQLIQSFAYGLRQLGMEKDGKVAILSGNSPAWTISDFAILMCGAVTVPIYPTQTAEQVSYILQNADVEILIAENKAQAEKAQAANASSLRCIIVIEEGEDLSWEWQSYRDVLQNGYAKLQALGPLTSWQRIEATSLATIVHTSGTTGRPKGVMLTHQNLLANIQATLVYVPLSARETTLSYLPLSHIFERTCGQFAVLSSGATLAYAESIDCLADNLLEVRPTVMTSVPRLFEKIYDGVLKTVRSASPFKQKLFQLALTVGKQHRTKKTLKTRLLHPLLDRLVFRKIRARMGGRIRLLISGGAALSPEICEFFHLAGLPINEGYGMTETAPVVATNPASDIRIGTVGRPLQNLQVKIADDGEVLVKGPSVMVGYYKNDEATNEAFTEDGWLRTGDIGTLQDGYLRIVERKKNILVLATGKNVAPFPVESALCRSPYISQVILLGDKRKYITALLVPDFAALNEWLDTQPFSLTSPARNASDFLAHQAVLGLYEKEVREQLQAFAPFEQPKKFTLLPRELSLEAGEVTVTLKVRTHILQSRYRAEIEAMYAEGESDGAEVSAEHTKYRAY